MSPALVTCQVWLLRLALAFLAASFLLFRQGLADHLRSVPRRTWGALAAIVAASFAARLLGSAWNVDHENALAYKAFQDALFVTQRPNFGLGLAGPVLWNAALAVAPTDLRTLFALHCVLGGLTPALLFVAARRVHGSDAAALLSAALLGFNPVHVRLAATENLYIPQLFFCAFALALGALALEQPRARWALLSATIALLIAMQFRPVGLLYALPALALFFLRSDGVEGWRRHPALRAAIVACVVLLPLHVLGFFQCILPEARRLNLSRAHLPGLFDPWSNPTIDPATTPLVLMACTVAGIAALVLTERRALAITLPIFLGVVWLNDTPRSDIARLRYALEPAFFACLIAGAAMHHLRKGDKRLPAAALALAVLVSAGELVARRPLLARRFDAQREFSFLTATAASLPSEALVVVPATDDHFTADPWLWLSSTGRHLTPVEAKSWLRDPARWPLATAQTVLWYRGITCWIGGLPSASPTPRALPLQRFADPRMRSQCRQIEQTFRLEPLAVTRFAANPEDDYGDRSDHLEIGFYRLHPAASPPPPPPPDDEVPPKIMPSGHGP